MKLLPASRAFAAIAQPEQPKPEKPNSKDDHSKDDGGLIHFGTLRWDAKTMAKRIAAMPGIAASVLCWKAAMAKAATAKLIQKSESLSSMASMFILVA